MKLTLRDLFWLVLVCALAVGWWVERTRIQKVEGTLKVAREQYDWLGRFVGEQGYVLERDEQGFIIGIDNSPRDEAENRLMAEIQRLRAQVQKSGNP